MSLELEEIEKRYISEIESFCAHLYEEEGKKEGTIKRYRYDLLFAARWASDKEVDFDLIDLFDDYLLRQFIRFLREEKKYAANTTRRILGVLNKFHMYTFGFTNPIVEDNLSDEKRIQKKTKSDFLTNKEIKYLLQVFSSEIDLSPQQIKVYYMIGPRNKAITLLMVKYGLSLQEVSSLKMSDIHWGANTIDLLGRKSREREIRISKEDKSVLFHYYKTIPNPVRPSRGSSHPFIVAFDFKRQTYHWDYLANRPKYLAEVSIQKMFRSELRRAGFSIVKSARELRNTYILHQILLGRDLKDLKIELNMETTQPFNPYLSFIEEHDMSPYSPVH